MGTVTAADIPPELFDDILFYVCEHAWSLLDLSLEIQNRKEAVKDVAACSLTCVYWARFCRQWMFRNISVRNYDDMCAFSSLVVNTPKTLQPICEYVDVATLVQHVGDRPWLHLLLLHRPLFPFRPHTGIYFRIWESPSGISALQRPTSRGLFAGLPRTLPSSCHQCHSLIIDNPHLHSLHDLASLIGRFAPISIEPDRWYVTLNNVAWLAQACFNSDLLITPSLDIFPYDAAVEVQGSAQYHFETAWMAYSAVMHSKRSSLTSMRLRDGDRVLRLLPFAQRFIVDIGKFLCQGHPMRFLTIAQCPGIRILYENTYLYSICEVSIDQHMRMPHVARLSFHASEDKGDHTGDQGLIYVVDRISVVSMFIHSGELDELAPSGKFPASGAYADRDELWGDIVRLCTEQEGFLRLQLEFHNRSVLDQFMELRQVDVAKLAGGRVGLFYRGRTYGTMYAVDFQTLADLGEARGHGYINCHQS